MSCERSVDPRTFFTRAECERILAQACGPQLLLEDYSVEPAKGLIGFLGTYYLLILRYVAVSDEPQCKVLTDRVVQQRLIFVKSLPPATSECLEDAIFRKESQLYARLLTKLQAISDIKWSAKCFYVRDNLFALEYLPDLGYQLAASADNTFDELQVKQVLCSLAAMHAASIAYELENGVVIGSEYADVLQEISVSPSVAWYTVGVRAILAAAQQHPKFQSEELQHFIAAELPQQLAAVYAMVNASSKYRNVLCHRDPWRGNVFFNSANNGNAAAAAVLVDYQTCRYCPPAIDVIFALFMNLSSDDRRRQEPAYLRWYYQRFRNDLERRGIAAQQHISEQQLTDSYSELKLFGFVYKCLAVTMLNVPRDMVTDDYRNVERRPQLLQHMRDNSTFRTCMESAIEEMFEFLLTE